MAETSPQPEASTANPRQSASPPPNCAICLGNCINKCFSDSCMHQFCFKCLLEWSKVKPVCPLCKQPFSSIIHNVKSNDEYDEHFIATETNNSQEAPFRDIIDPPAYDLFVAQSSRHFQFRTTFTVDPRGELAIQQLLSTHPLTTNSFQLSMPAVPNSYVPRTLLRRLQHDFSSSNFRRFIYDEDLWVHALPDITGRFRDVCPQYFRENPAARNRLVPWLNRELNALLYENTQHVMHVCDQILSQLTRHHLTSRYFHQLIEQYLGSRTDHFIHEFYNFMRSPYDMIGYDRVVNYSHTLRVRIESSDDDEDSDVVIVGTQQRTDPVVIEIDSDSSHDSDVIIREPTPPVVVDLVDSESEHEKPILPLKIRLKRKRQNKEKKSRRRDCSSSESDSSTGSSTSGEETRVKSRKRYQKQKYYIVKSTDSDSDSENQSLNKLKKEWEDKKRKKAKKSKRKQKGKSARHSTQLEPTNNPNPDLPEINPDPALPEEHKHTTPPENKVYYKVENVQSDQSTSYTPPPRDTIDFNQPQINITTQNGISEDVYKSDVVERTIFNTKWTIYNEFPGPSNTNGEFPHKGTIFNNWYSRPVVLNSDDDSD